jgi:hypothetical protein
VLVSPAKARVADSLHFSYDHEESSMFHCQNTSVDTVSDFISDGTPSLANLFDQCIAEIESAYATLDHKMGWRFLTSPSTTLSSATEVALITLNPGGKSDDSESHPHGSSEKGSAYLTESWDDQRPGNDKLQLQIQALIQGMQSRLGFPGTWQDYMNSQVLSAHFVPFRSPNIKALHESEQSMDFARTLWGQILGAWMPRILITIDRKSYEALDDLLRAHANLRAVSSRRLPTGWGEYQADVLRFEDLDDRGPVTLVRLPHLSRFTLFHSAARKPFLDALLDYVTDPLRISKLVKP